MKQWMISVFAAIVGGFIVFILQAQYQNYNKSLENAITITEKDNSALLNQDDIAKINKAVENDVAHRAVYIHVVTVKNTGSQDISGKSLSAPTAGAIAFGNISTPNSNDKNVRISSENNGITVRYQLLPSGESHTFWIASQDYIPNTMNFSADDPGVSLIKGDPISSDSFWSWMGMIGGAVAFLFIGVGVGQAAVQSELKARGIDVAATLKQPKIP